VQSSGTVAVVDVETTGLYKADRVVEIAIVTVDATGIVVEEFETLINPNRDVGPTWIHGVTASMVVAAPTFEEVAHQVASRLDGAVVCAHNLPFDTRMLLAELGRSGMAVDWGVGVDTLSATGAKLEVACADAGIALPHAHRALDDARATAALLAVHAGSVTSAPQPAKVGPYAVAPVRILTRAGAAVAEGSVEDSLPFIAKLSATVQSDVDLAPYMELLDVAIADLKLTAEERTALAELAGELGLTSVQVDLAHKTFISQLLDAAIADRVVTGEEYDQLARAAVLLGVDVAVVDARTEGLRSDATLLELKEGMSVCFTGEATDGDETILRDDLEMVCIRAGLDPVSAVTAKGCDLLVAADPASRSGKAAKARKWGIPVASVDNFISSLATGDPLEVSVLSSPGTALVCTRCGGSWLSARRSSSPVCGDCKQPAPKRAASAEEVPAPVGNDPGMASETLTCADCGREWERVRTRGRKPSCCPECA
jgi:DNA polymerase III epsilon subunit-like protein